MSKNYFFPTLTGFRTLLGIGRLNQNFQDFRIFRIFTENINSENPKILKILILTISLPHT
jgi:hypothetical protein